MPGDVKPCVRQFRAHLSKQRGAALLVALLLALTISLSFFFKAANTGTVNANRQQASEKVMAQAKSALIGWSVLQGDIGSSPSTRRPGTLPCPDTDNSGNQAASCSAAGGTSIGRLPWKTLGIEDLRDAEGERLWYALSNDFRRPGLNNKVINSDTQGTLQLYASDGASLLTPAGEELAAIIFSAGAPLAGQDRLAGPNDVANYLEMAFSRNNASASGPFISGPIRDAQGGILLNDRAIGISAQELISAIEKRALKEAEKGLAAYALANGRYPNPARPGGAYCATKKSDIGDINTCNSDNTICFGRLPEDALNLSYVALWFLQNGWGRVIAYAANKNSVQDPSAPECSTSLNVDGAPMRYVLVAPGSARSGQTRPSSSLVNYLEDTANKDAWTSLSSGQATFTAPSSTSNDQLRSLP